MELSVLFVWKFCNRTLSQPLSMKYIHSHRKWIGWIGFGSGSCLMDRSGMGLRSFCWPVTCIILCLPISIVCMSFCAVWFFPLPPTIATPRQHASLRMMVMESGNRLRTQAQLSLTSLPRLRPSQSLSSIQQPSIPFFLDDETISSIIILSNINNNHLPRRVTSSALTWCSTIFLPGVLSSAQPFLIGKRLFSCIDFGLKPLWNQTPSYSHSLPDEAYFGKREHVLGPATVPGFLFTFSCPENRLICV